MLAWQFVTSHPVMGMAAKICGIVYRVVPSFTQYPTLKEQKCGITGIY
jgi:hypothetical protein